MLAAADVAQYSHIYIGIPATAAAGDLLAFFGYNITKAAAFQPPAAWQCESRHSCYLLFAKVPPLLAAVL